MVIGNSTWSAMVLRNKFERWDDNFVDIKDMEPKELCKYYLSTKKIIKNHKPNNNMNKISLNIPLIIYKLSVTFANL